MFFRDELTGDTNYLSSPLLTIRKILGHPVLGKQWAFVDIGCGEGLVGLFVRLILRKSVILHDQQTHFLAMIRFFCRLFFVNRVRCQPVFDKDYPAPSVFLCVWTSWSDKNREDVVYQLSSVVPKGSFLITVSHGLIHPAFIELNKSSEMFAWGRASVYYYKHA